MNFTGKGGDPCQHPMALGIEAGQCPSAKTTQMERGAPPFRGELDSNQQRRQEHPRRRTGGEAKRLWSQELSPACWCLILKQEPVLIGGHYVPPEERESPSFTVGRMSMR